MPATDENLRVVLEVTGAFANLGINYALIGSWASSLMGKPRFTQDADLTVEPFPGQEAALCNSFGPEYYVNLSAIQQAVRQRSSFNIINTTAGFKVDVFVSAKRAFDTSVMERRRPTPIPNSGQALSSFQPRISFS